MRLVDILFLSESDAANDAERLGLERKPGFGNYGPKGQDVITHRSRGGKLHPVKSRSSKKPPEQKLADKKSQSKPTKSAKPKRVRKSPKITRQTTKKLSQSLITSFGKSNKQSSTEIIKNQVLPLFGRSDLNTRINPPDQFDGRSEVDELLRDDTVAGIYIAEVDGIFVRETAETKHLPSVRQWNQQQADYVHTILHESIHAASPRKRTSKQFYERSPTAQMFGTAFEEGLTELIASRTMYDILEDGKADSNITITRAYPDAVRAVELMETHTSLSAEQLFTIQNHDDFMRVGVAAARATRNRAMSKLYASKEITQMFDEKAGDFEGDVIYPAMVIFDKKFQEFIKFVENTDIKDSNHKNRLRRDFLQLVDNWIVRYKNWVKFRYKQ